MNRAYLGLLALDALYLGAGLGLLIGFGHVRSIRSGLRLSGVAFTVGWAAVGIVSVFLLVGGLSLAPWQVVLASGALALGGVLLARIVPRIREPERAPVRARALVVLAGAVLMLYVEGLGLRALAAGASHHQDAWGFWLPKAKAIALFGGLDTGPGGVTSYSHPDYPPLLPALEASAFRFMDGLHASLLPVQEWVVGVAFLGALAGLLVRRVPAAILVPSLALIALSPSFGRVLGLALADLPLAMLFALAGVAVALWLADGHHGYVALAAILLAAAALTKVEGRSLGIVLAAMTALASVRALRTRWPGLVALLAVPVLAWLPWQRWLEANDVPIAADHNLGDVANAGYLLDRTDRLEQALTELPRYLVGGDDWLLVLPLALAAAALLVRRAPALALLLAGTPIAVLAGLVLVYWVSVVPIDHYIDTSADRAVLSPLLFAAALLPLALAALLGPERATVLPGSGVPPNRPRIDDVEGHASISAEVLSRYAADAALEVEGVRGLVDRALPYRRGVKLDEDDGRVTVELRLAVEWGASIPAVGKEVQQRVREYLKRMADVDAERVDVVVDEVA